MVITDSLSSLQALKSQRLNNPIVSNILHYTYVALLVWTQEHCFFAGYPAILEYRAMSGLVS